MKKFLTLLFLLSNLAVCGVSAETVLEGRVVAVADGDTLTVLDAQQKQHKIRLLGIDAPEKAQPFGQKSKESLSLLAFQKQVQVRSSKKDRYGRTVGQVFVGNTDVCLEQVKLGMAWHYKAYQREQVAGRPCLVCPRRIAGTRATGGPVGRSFAGRAVGLQAAKVSCA